MLNIDGKPLLLHTLEQTKKASNVSRVIVATDSRIILKVVEESGNEAVMTSISHQSGSDRVAEVAESLAADSIIVNVQGDEPMISPKTIEKAVDSILSDETIEISTTCEKISDYRDVLSSNVVKVVVDKDNFALYFSRSPVAFPREAVARQGSLENALMAEKELLSLFRKHTGLYAYRRESLLSYSKLKRTTLEKIEMLEQLRVLENGFKIKVIEVEGGSMGVDTEEDFIRVKSIVEKRSEL